MSDDKRTGQNPVPEKLGEYLNPAQLSQLHSIESFGWHLKFVRRPLFQDVLVVVENAQGDQIGVLTEEGEIEIDPNIDLREHEKIQ